jgi:hypothetical protein
VEESTIDQKLHRDKSNSCEFGLQEFLQPTPQKDPLTQNTLKEISELKNEIIKLTQSLRTVKPAEESPQLRESKNMSASKGLKLTKKGFREDDILP